MAKNKIKRELDLGPVLERALVRYEQRIITAALLKLFPNEKFIKEEFSIRPETVSGYAAPVTTVRYKGEVLMRRFSTDFLGLKYRFESPIFED